MFVRQVLALVFLTAAAGMAAGQEAVGPEFLVNSVTTNPQDWPAISADRDGNFVVVG